jgi:hypothetical protein
VTESQDSPLSAANVDSPSPPESAFSPRAWAVAALVVLGVALIALPVTFDMFNRAPRGATMIGGFRPFMTQARLDGFQQDIRQINAGVQESKTSVAAYLTRTANTSSGPAAFDTQYPGFASFATQWGAIDAHMTNLLDDVQDNLANYQAVAALPSFKLFPWFFVVPGVLVLIDVGVLVARPGRRRTARWVLIALGVGLVLAPAAFQMFQRAPKGGHMMSAFKSIETTSNVQNIQGYFGSMAVGQGAIRLELVPALQRVGLTDADIDARFPAVRTLDQNWVHILNDMTPMIGAMSDNVLNYQAVAALPPFPLFPYFFVLPGLLIAGTAIALVPGRAARDQPSRRSSSSPTASNPQMSEQSLSQV